MHLAALNGSTSACPLLITEINVNRTTKDGKTPLDKAMLMGHEAVAQLLLRKGANINANLVYSRFSTIRDHQKVVKLLEEVATQNKKMQHKAMLTFLLASHPRVGAKSNAKILPKEMFQMIWEFVKISPSKIN